MDYIARLGCSAFGGRRVLALLLTDPAEDREELCSALGAHPAIESITPLHDDRYLITAVCCGLDEYHEILNFLHNEKRVTSMEAFPLRDEPQHSRPFARTELDMLACLCRSPRMAVKDIALQTGHTTKSIARTIRRLVSYRLVELTIQASLHLYLAKFRFNETGSQLPELLDEATASVKCHWESMHSSSGDTSIQTFVMTDPHIAFTVRRSVQDIAGVSLEDEAFCAPARHYQSTRHEKMRNLFQN
jgi:hypothetical protein